MATQYLITFIEGMLTFVSPCILPLLPVYVSFLAGSSAGNPVGNLTGKAANEAGGKMLKQIANTVAFIAGFTVVFVLMGAAATTIGMFLQQHNETLRKISGIMMVVFGLGFLGLYRIPIFERTVRFGFSPRKSGVVPAAILGVVFALGWTPCSGPLLGSALLLASSSGTVAKGMTLLVFYSLGLGVPFFITAVVLEKVREATRWFSKHGRAISYISGGILIITGILVYTNLLWYLFI